MRCNASTAQEFYEHLPVAKKISTLYPEYVLADAVRNKALEPFFWCASDKGSSLYHAGHLGRIVGTDAFDLQTAYGYGGPVCMGDSIAAIKNLWTQYDEWCCHNNVVVEFVRFHPMLENQHGYPGRIMPQRETVWIDLMQDDLLCSYKTRIRTTVRKALKSGVRVKWVDSDYFISFFPEFYRQAMTEIGADKHYFFTDSYFKMLLQMKGVHCGICLVDNEIISAAVFFSASPYMEYHLSASMQKGKHFGASSLLIHEAAKLGKIIGCEKLYLGGGDNNSKENTLLFFKTGFSTKRKLFSIGSWVHLHDSYESLKLTFPEAYACQPQRVLFYRQEE